MRNKSVSDFVAATMDAVLKSEAHKSLFGNTYKFAAETCDKCHKIECVCDASSAWDNLNADDNDARKKKESESTSESSEDSDSNSAHDEECADESDASDSTEEMESSAFDVAIDSLLTASAALDSVGLEKGSSLSLKLASLVVEAKKKDKETKKSTKGSKKSDKKDSKKSDSNAAKDKGKKKSFPFFKKKDTKSTSSSSSKSTSSKSTSSKSTSSKSSPSTKSSKKLNPFAKKK